MLWFFVSLLLALVIGKDFAGLGEQLPGPNPGENYTTWLDNLRTLRANIRQKINYTGGVYSMPQLKFTQTNYVSTQMHPFDRKFYDHDKHEFLVDAYVNFTVEKFGGLDSALIWQTYPNIGIDNRNQYDLTYAIPGGMKTLKKVVQQLHAHNIYALFPYNPWDQGSNDTGIPDEVSLTNMILSVDGDGFNGDTMPFIPDSFFQESVKQGKPFALEPEGGGSEASLNYQTFGWGYWNYPQIPMVDTWKWITPHRVTHVCNRWAKNRTDDLQAAFFNGVGYVAWMNVWGTYNDMTPRDGEALRRVGTLLRYLSRAEFLHSEQWQPHYPDVHHPRQVFASMFPREWRNLGEVAWTLVNTGGTNTTGSQLSYTIPPGSPVLHFYDLYHGRLLASSQAGRITLQFDVEINGFGCILATPNTTDSDESLKQVLSTMARLSTRSLSFYDATWRPINQTKVPQKSTLNRTNAPEGMVEIPQSLFNFQVSGVEIEGSDPGVDFQYAWEDYPRRNHQKMLAVPRFFIDKFPVTNAEYQSYLEASQYKPRDAFNFLRDWKDGKIPEGWDNRPVTWVSLAEARAFCTFYDKRLVSEVEWQKAAQGNTGYLYPWGNEFDSSRIPAQQHGRVLPGPDPVGAHSPEGDSVHGVADLVGNVWQYTDEYEDEHTRAVVVRGSSYYRPSGSMWYFPECLQLNQHNKYLLYDETYERAGTLGFRCAVDADATCSSYLCGKVYPTEPSVDLTAEGSVDWIHLGLTAADSVERSADCTTNCLGVPVVESGCSALQYDNNPTAYSWSNGKAPHQSANNTHTGIYALDNCVGFNFTTTVSGVEKLILRLYLGVYDSQGTLMAKLEQDSHVLEEYTDASMMFYTGSFNGVYELEITPPSSPATLSVRWHTARTCTKSVCVQLNTSPPDVDLSQRGDYDWMHWGLNGATSVDRAMVKKENQVISTFTTIGRATVMSFDNNPTTYTWSNGTPDKQVSKSATGVYVAGENLGFQVKVAVSSLPAKVKIFVYVGVYQSRGKLSLAYDDSTPFYTDTNLSTTAGTAVGMYAIQLEVKPTAKELVITWTQVEGDGNITLESVAVSTLVEGNATFQAITLAKK
eukprot:m.59824 g.59824  ORF g.59824 m.59824 type:complete len:1092 (-) comp19131_c0_seq3:44-3319(-)